MAESSDICVRLRVLNPDRNPRGGTVDIDAEPQNGGPTLKFKAVDAAKDIDMRGLQRTPQGLYKLTITPTDVFRPVSQFITVPASGFVTVEVVIEAGSGLQPAVDGIDRKSTGPEVRKFFDERNRSVRVDVAGEIDQHMLAALRTFTRRLGAPHLLDEVIIPILHEGDSQIITAVQDRPWPPWGLGARRIVALCQTHEVGADSYAVSPVYVTEEDLTNVGLITAVFREALEQLASSPHAEICYLVAEHSTLADYVLTGTGFKRSDDVFVNWSGRYHTYRAPVSEALRNLGIENMSTPDLLAHDMDNQVLQKNALFHQTLINGSRAEWAAERAVSEIINLVRGGHASKPGGVPSGTGRFGYDPIILERFVSVANVLGDRRQALLDYVLSREQQFSPATVTAGEQMNATVDEKIRRARTLNDLGEFERMFVDRIRQELQPALERIRHKPFPVGRIELQITASNDGDYFRLHRDTSPEDTREVSFVYFFHREPRRFSGGELRIYETRMIDGQMTPADHASTLSPRQDTLIFFSGKNEHEILPVRVPSREFGDSRFTVNGWIHRKE